MSVDLIAQASIRVAAITPKTKWIFVELRTSSGAIGVGEATTQGKEDFVVDAFKALVHPLAGGRSPRDLVTHLERKPLPLLPISSVVSALDQAVWDLIGKDEGQSVASALGGVCHRHITAYANINRRTTDRTLEGFAKSAGEAIAYGHRAIKIAPFDEAIPGMRGDELRQAVGHGIARMLAVREEIGRERRLMIDCHWRLDLTTARYVIDAAAEAGLYWVECPLPEAHENIPSIKALRIHANKCGVRLAGCEEMIRLDGFAPFLNAGAYDVLMPDVKYVGGLNELLRIAERATKAGIEISPHNPSGPICHAASLQVCAALPQNSFLETQYDEADLFEKLQARPLPKLCDGKFGLSTCPGLGVSLDGEAVKQVEIFRWDTEV
jgi:galactonate dehydratase